LEPRRSASADIDSESSGAPGSQPDGAPFAWWRGSSDAVPPVPRTVDTPAYPRDELNERCAGWLRRLAAGDAEAFEPLYHATLPRLWGLAFKVLGRESDTEDVLSEAYTQVWRDAGRYDAARGSALAWLSIICRSRAIDCLRRRDHATTGEDSQDLLDGLIDPRSQDCGSPFDGHVAHEDPLRGVAWGQSRRELDTALAELPPVERQLIVLAYYRDLSQTELAQALNMPLGTVKSRTRRALAELRHLLTTETLS